MKVIRINTPNGQYDIPLQFIAENRADYHVLTDVAEKEGHEWKQEVAWMMKNDFEGIHWILNDMNWEDVNDFATKVNDQIHVTDDDFWTSSNDFEILDNGK